HQQGAVPGDPDRPGGRRAAQAAPQADRPPADRRSAAADAASRQGKLGSMFVLVVGAGRVGAAVATSALRAGHTVSVLDEDPLSHERLDVELGKGWEEAGGRFTIGTA